MWVTFKKVSLLSFFIAILGGTIGGISWLLLFIINMGISFLWENPPLYPVILCGIGGLLIGLWNKRFGPYPRELNEILSTIKKGEKIPYNNLHIIAISAILPLIFGGNLGPEAGLSGIIAGLCFWFSDRFKFIFSELEDLPQVGVAASIGIIFGSPLFAFINQIENPDKPSIIPKRTKIFMYFIGILSGFGIFTLLQNLVGTRLDVGRFPPIQIISESELISALPLVAIGITAGLLYYLSLSLIKKAFRPLQKHIVIKAILGGIVLGGVATFLPYVMFSGEHQLTPLILSWEEMAISILLLTGIMKIFVGSFCHEMGWRGGNIFPTIFAGVSIGYAFALILPVDPIFCVAIITSALTASIMRKPLAVILLLLIFFPLNTMIPLTIGAIIGGVIPIPRIFLVE